MKDRSSDFSQFVNITCRVVEINLLRALAVGALFFSGQTVVGIPLTFERRIAAGKLEYFDPQNNLVYASADKPKPFDVKEGSPFAQLLGLICGPHFGGSYEGTNTTTYKGGGAAEQKITIKIEQTGNDIGASFAIPGGEGKGTGKLTGNKVESMSLQSTVPDCPGTYQASLEFAGDTLSWMYQGEDCGSVIEGRGTAKKAKS
jgi:hypothetical protein